ncbi:MAG: exodeoxyribonuclease VII small subunit [Acholeplasmataceae bacterium]
MEQTFEAMLEQLENVVKKLETKEIALDDAVKEYKKGLELAKACYSMLENAEKVLVKTQE